VIDEALGQPTRTDERWCMAELLRVKSRNALLQATPTAIAQAEDRLQRSLGWARQCNRLCRLRYKQNQVAQGRDLLASIYAQCTEGLHTSDLTAAKRLLER
jgi:hypothetical protein